MELIVTGLALPDLGLLLIRWMLGTFFVLARMRWLYDLSGVKFFDTMSPEARCYIPPAQLPHDLNERFFPAVRHASLRWKLHHCGYSDHPLLAGFVALVEIFAGMAVIVGLFTPLAAFGLASVLLFAMLCITREKVAKQNPIDCVDWFCCLLWTVEPVYFMLAVTLVITGAGSFSVDHFLYAHVTLDGMVDTARVVVDVMQSLWSTWCEPTVLASMEGKINGVLIIEVVAVLMALYLYHFRKE